MNRINVNCSTAETKRLLEELQETACRKLEDAISLPPNVYRDLGIAHLEQEKIWKQGWVCPGLAAEIPNAGDYIEFSVADESFFTVRNDEGEIRSFSNVCRHRMMKLVKGKGNNTRITCPYHAWSYDFGGQLISAGHMLDNTSFNKADHCLPEFRTEIWNGWIYVTLNNDAPSVETLLAPLYKQVARYDMQNYIPVASQDHLWHTNWKLLTENFMESYHLPVAHKETVGAWIGLEDTVFPEEFNESFTYQTFTKDDDAALGTAHADNTALKGKWRNTSVMPTVFPAHMYVLAPDHLWYLTLRPRGVNQVAVRFGLAIAPELYQSKENPEQWVKELVEFFDQVNEEDRNLVEGIYAGSRSEYAATGPLSWLEREIHDFERYLASKLCSSDT